MTILTALKAENLRNPLAVGTKTPALSWNVEADGHGWKQAAYQILAAESQEQLAQDDATLWDSGRVESGHMCGVAYGGLAPALGRQCWWKVRVWPQSGAEPSAYSAPACWETGPLTPSDWQGKWIGEEQDHVYHIFRKGFTLGGEVASARLYISGLGHYELYLNGGRVGDYVLDPGWTNYHKSCLYTAYDVTALINAGENAVGVLLGDGMYNVPGGRYVYFTRSYGKCKLLLQLNLVFKDGCRLSVSTDESWAMAKSPLTFSCIYGGEDYDARLEQAGFSAPGFDTAGWQPVKVAEAPTGQLVPQLNPPLKIMETLCPLSVKETKPGVYLYDLGRNFSGWAKIRLKAGKDFSGHGVKLTPGELLNAEGEPEQRVTGRGYAWTYTMNGKEAQTYQPHFTYYGFRYVQVEGAVPRALATGEALPVIESLEGCFIYPDVERAGGFECSNTLFNQIHEIINRAMLSNMKSVLTDCPHREKLGWLEQTHLIGPGLMLNYDLHGLYTKIQRDMRESQRDDGLVPDIAPEYVVFGYHKGFQDSPEWGSASVINPWYVYRQYGDLSILENNYDVMERYTDYLTSKTHHSILHHGLGDWLDIGPNVPFSQNTPVPVIATCVYYMDLSIMAKAAALLGKADGKKRWQGLMRQVKAEFNLQFYDDQTCRYATGSQAAQALALMAGLAEEENRQKVLDYLVEDIQNRKYGTTAGDVGHPYVLAALTVLGRSDVVNEMMNVTDAPGYGYQVKCGATTLTEEWDGPDPERPHGSQNHLMLGAGEEWFYSGLGGIQSIRAEDAFGQVTIAPHFAKGVDWVKAWHRHPHGRISVEWSRGEAGKRIRLVIPPNTTARLKLEDAADFAPAFAAAQGVTSAKAVGCHLELALGSGAYEFVI